MCVFFFSFQILEKKIQICNRNVWCDGGVDDLEENQLHFEDVGFF